jgi:NRPS condensation-like uncharacterized protein
MSQTEQAIDHLSALEKRQLLATVLQQKLQQSRQFPLSFAQQRLWFLDQLEPGNPAYNILIAVQLTGALNRQALAQALNTIVQRHEALRTTFCLVDGQPVQQITATLQLELPIVDLQSLTAEQQRQAVQQRAVTEAQRSFDLSQAPLLRSQLLQLAETEHVILLTLHHIVSDGWSMDVLVRELATLYNAFTTGQMYALPELPIQYADFAVWQRQQLQGEYLDSQIRYWRKQLEPVTELATLPTDYPHPTSQRFQGSKYSVKLSLALTEALKTLSQQEGVTLFMTLLAAFQVLLYARIGQPDIRVGTPIANRDRAEVAGLIGFFTNTLILRTDLSDNPSFQELLQRVKKIALAAYAHQELPFEKLVDELQLERSLVNTPLYQVWFYLQTDPTHSVSISGLTLKPLDIDIGTAKHDLKLGLWDSSEGLKGAFEYRTDLFATNTISRLAQHYAVLLEQIVAQPNQLLEDLVVHLKHDDRQQQTTQSQTLQSAGITKLKQTRRKALST